MIRLPNAQKATPRTHTIVKEGGGGLVDLKPGVLMTLAWH
jgi:hypothetical protein